MAEAIPSIPNPFGPTYDVNSVALAKFRRKPFGELTRDERRAYGEAVEKAVLVKQRALLYREATPDYRSPCASGTWHTTGEAIHAAILQQQRAALVAYPAKVCRERGEAGSRTEGRSHDPALPLSSLRQRQRRRRQLRRVPDGALEDR
jgi:hypothetical protein